MEKIIALLRSWLDEGEEQKIATTDAKPEETIQYGIRPDNK
jgi:hypothetical protein